MPRPPIDLGRYIRLIPEHVSPLPAEAYAPVLHYNRAANDSWNLLLYTERNLRGPHVYAAARDRHLESLRVMILLSLVEAFERFLKELAAVCIDQVGQLIPDDRLDIFNTRGATVALHLGTGTLGKVLCESSTWCDCDDANERFRRVLADPYDKGTFYVFPKQANQQPASLRGTYETMSIVWQLRHAIVHNRGVITASDALKFRLLCRRVVAGPRQLVPTHADVWYVKLFLDETTETINAEVGCRLADLLTLLYARDSSLFNPADKAQQVADLLREPSTVAGQLRHPT